MNWMKNWTFRKAASGLTGLWAFLLLTAFPLYAPEQYSRMGIHKFEFFLGISAACLLPAAVFSMIGKPDGCLKRRKRIGMSVLDWAMLAYLAACLLSWAFAIDRRQGWTGISGWFMGLRTQIFFVLIYFLVSRVLCVGTFWKKALLAGHLLGAGAVFLLGVLHRFRIDPLDLYRGLDDSVQLLFLSTIGQATWYSSFVCTVLPIGLCLFYVSDKVKIRVISGIYCTLGFMTLVTQNSDSAFAALAALLFGLFLASCVSPKRMERFLEVVILCAASFKAIGFLQRGFPEQAVQLGSLSEAFSMGVLSWILLLFGAAFYILLLHMEEKRGVSFEKSWEKTGRRLFTLACILTGIFLIAVIGGIALNTTGLLEQWFGISSDNQYLLFNDKWGSNRGFNWKMAVRIFAGLPFLHKIIGVGPDCFMAYSYSVPEYAQLLNDYWKPDVLTNAHNEFLNLLICIGAGGLISFLLLLGAGARRFYRIGKEHPEVLMGLLAVCSYAAHNFFCYQQVCCTPFLFLILGLSERLARRREEAEDGKRQSRQEIPE